MIRAFINEIDKFRNPVYLAYYDEHKRQDEDTQLAKDLDHLSSTLNLTYQAAVYSVVRRSYIYSLA